MRRTLGWLGVVLPVYAVWTWTVAFGMGWRALVIGGICGAVSAVIYNRTSKYG